MARGRPRKNSVSQLQTKIEKYFTQCKTDKDTPTISGLCYACGYSDRHAFLEMKKQPDYTSIVGKTMLRLASEYESLLSRGCNNTGAIFWLKNHGWRDDTGIKTDKPINMINLVVSESTKQVLEAAVANVTDDQGI